MLKRERKRADLDDDLSQNQSRLGNGELRGIWGRGGDSYWERQKISKYGNGTEIIAKIIILYR